MHLNSLPAELA